MKTLLYCLGHSFFPWGKIQTQLEFIGVWLTPEVSKYYSVPGETIENWLLLSVLPKEKWWKEKTGFSREAENQSSPWLDISWKHSDCSLWNLGQIATDLGKARNSFLLLHLFYFLLSLDGKWTHYYFLQFLQLDLDSMFIFKDSSVLPHFINANFSFSSGWLFLLFFFKERQSATLCCSYPQTIRITMILGQIYQGNKNMNQNYKGLF